MILRELFMIGLVAAPVCLLCGEWDMAWKFAVVALAAFPLGLLATMMRMDKEAGRH